MERPRVTVSEGDLQGVSAVTKRGKIYYSFKGIPYAEPPIGQLRFRNPVPCKSWKGIRDASKEGNVAKQKDIFTGNKFGDEDCLFLNVHTPHLPREGQPLLSVMVYIHGGGFQSGSGNQEEFGPDYIVERDVVKVSLNYRLGVFGFLCLETPEAPGNMGLMDQNLALKWIHRNIQAFNGCPDNVTIFGISAGGASVEFHVLSPLSSGLFQKCIIQSGSATNFWANNKNIVKSAYILGEHLGGKHDNVEDLYNFLHTASADALVQGAVDIFKFSSTENYGELFAFCPTICAVPGHENFLEEDPLTLLATGNFNKVPTIMGYCFKEGMFIGPLFYNQEIVNLKKGDFIKYIPSNIKIDRQATEARLRELYKPQNEDLNADDYVIDFLSDFTFVGGMYASLIHRLKYTSENYNYCFAYDGNMNFLKKMLKFTEAGACHSDELTYLGPTISLPDDNAIPQDIIVMERMVQMWTDFAKYGNPTPKKTDKIETIWLPATSQNIYRMDIGDDLVLTEENNENTKKRRELWQDIYNSHLNLK